MRKQNPPVCINCGCPGHVCKRCNQPVISCGVVCASLCPDTSEPLYLMVRRRDTFSFIEYVRGNYSLENKDCLLRLFAGMTGEERDVVLSKGFDDICKRLWRGSVRGDSSASRKSHDLLREGYWLVRTTGKKEFVNSASVASETAGAHRDSPEWGFPKGRRSRSSESDLQCALRETSEETGIGAGDIAIVHRRAYDETFNGSNGVRYKHVYFLAAVAPAPAGMIRHCPHELSGAGWFTSEGVLSALRGNVQRCEVFRRIDKSFRSFLDPPSRRPSPSFLQGTIRGVDRDLLRAPHRADRPSAAAS